MNNIEAVYPLSPLQQGLLFHSLYLPAGGAYFEQVSGRFVVPIDAGAFRDAWRFLVDRHDILRTAFVWQNLEEPVQVVGRKVRLPFTFEDWTHLPPHAQDARFEESLRADQERGYDLNRAPLMRVALFRLSDSTHAFVWSHHHILMDGWSWAQIIRELSVAYEAIRRGETPTLPRVQQFRDFVRWARAKDLRVAERYWSAHLRGLIAPTRLPMDRRPGQWVDRHEPEIIKSAAISIATTGRLRERATSHGVTVNTVMQGLWALVLGAYSGDDEVVHGFNVSCRPADLPGVESIVGLFVNTLPFRTRLTGNPPLWQWLEELQRRHLEAREHEHTPLASIQQCSELPRHLPLFESVLSFQNHPGARLAEGANTSPLSAAASGWQLPLEDARWTGPTNYPLVLRVSEESRLDYAFAYYRSRFADSSVERLVGDIEQVVTLAAERPDIRLDEMVRALAGHRARPTAAPAETFAFETAACDRDRATV